MIIVEKASWSAKKFTVYQSWDFEGKTDGDSVEDAYTEWVPHQSNSNDIWRVEANNPRTGTRCSSIHPAGGGYGNNQGYSYTLTTPDKVIQWMSFRWYFDCRSIGVGVSQIWHIGIAENLNFAGSNIAAYWSLSVSESGGNGRYTIISTARDDLGAVASDTVATNVVPTDYVGLRIDYDRRNERVYFLRDTGSGWVLENDYSLNGSIDPVYLQFANQSGSVRPFDQLFFDDLEYGESNGGIFPASEIICQGANGGNGFIQVKVPDQTLANLSDYDDFLKVPVEVRTNDNARIVWEGELNIVSMDQDVMFFEGREYLAKALGCRANYNPIQLTGVLDGAVDGNIVDWGTDPSGNGPLTSTYQSKHIAFVDRTLNEAHFFPKVTSRWVLADETTPFTPTTVTGDINDMTLLSDGTNTWTGQDTTLEDWYQELHFRVLVKDPDTAPDSFTFTWDLFWLQLQQYTVGGSAPKLQIYDYNLSSWETWATFNLAGGYGLLSTEFAGELSKTSSISDYLDFEDLRNGFNRYEMKIRFYCGSVGTPWSGTDIRINTRLAQLKFVFSNSQAITIDESKTVTASESDRNMSLQSNVDWETADQIGITKDDSYIIGTNMKTAMDAMWTAHDLNSTLTLTFDATTLGADFTDRTYESLLAVLRNYGKQLGRDIWQLHDGTWDVNCSASYTSTSLSLTEADVHNFNLPGSLKFSIDTTNLYKTIYVVGQTEVITGSQAISAEFTTIEELVIHDPTILSSVAAAAKAASVQDLHTNAVRELSFTIDYDKSGENYSALAVMKTISVNILSGVINISNYLLKSITWQQSPGGHLFATLQIGRRDQT